MKKTFVQDRVTGKFIEVTHKRSAPQSAAVHLPESFVSPIDGTIIDSKGKLAAHNKRHGVSNDPDSLREKNEAFKRQQNTPLSKRERLNDLVQAHDFVQQNQHLYH